MQILTLTFGALGGWGGSAGGGGSFLLSAASSAPSSDKNASARDRLSLGWVGLVARGSCMHAILNTSCSVNMIAGMKLLAGSCAMCHHRYLYRKPSTTWVVALGNLTLTLNKAM